MLNIPFGGNWNVLLRIVLAQTTRNRQRLTEYTFVPIVAGNTASLAYPGCIESLSDMFLLSFLSFFLSVFNLNHRSSHYSPAILTCSSSRPLGSVYRHSGGGGHDRKWKGEVRRWKSSLCSGLVCGFPSKQPVGIQFNGSPGNPLRVLAIIIEQKKAFGLLVRFLERFLA